MFRTIMSLCLLFIFVSPAWGCPSPNNLQNYEKQALALRERAYALTSPNPNSEKPLLSLVEKREILTKYQAEIDVLLNKAWREVSENMKAADPKLAKLLLNDQRAWLKFAESFCEKAQDHFGSGGTMYLTLAMHAKMNLWVERISYFRIINRSLTLE